MSPPGAGEEPRAAGRGLWLAGLGVLAELGRGGRAVLDELVARGRDVETRQFRALDRAVSQAAEGAERLGGEVRERLHDGVEEVLHRAHLPTRDDLRDLAARLDRLAERVDELTTSRQPTGRTP